MKHLSKQANLKALLITTITIISACGSDYSSSPPALTQSQDARDVLSRQGFKVLDQSKKNHELQNERK